MTWTRRDFIATGAGAALVTRIEPAAAEPAAAISSSTREQLRAVMDEIVPRQENMPSASEAGGVAYFLTLQQSEPAVAAGILAALGKLDKTSTPLEALRELERKDPPQFTILRDFVYEAYYTQPQVWKLIGYEFHATDHSGPHMKPFDEAVLANVRAKSKFYREA